MVVRDELLASHPDLAARVFEAFTESKRLYVGRLRAGAIEKPTAVDEMYQRVMQITGRDPLPYGIAPNRQALQELITAAHDQQIIPGPVAVEELFAPSTRTLVG
jgi:4,5-dihydroxyphthalate decarboxylase